MNNRLPGLPLVLVGIVLFLAGGQAVHRASALPAVRSSHYFPLILAPPPLPDGGCIPLPAIPPDDSAIERQVRDRLNHERAARGLAPLIRSAGLTQAARRHSHDMAANGVTGHTGSDGSTVAQRVEDTCYEWDRVGEIIGWGFPNPASMVGWWMGSAPHRGLILSSYLQDFGAGYVDQRSSRYRFYWTVVFGRERVNSTAVALPYTCTYQAGSALQGSLLIWRSAAPCPAADLPPDSNGEARAP